MPKPDSWTSSLRRRRDDSSNVSRPTTAATAATAAEAPVAQEAKAAARAGRKTWRGRFDTPAPGLEVSLEPTLVRGWVLHREHPVAAVVIAVDGRPHTVVTDFVERADVTERWPDAPHVERAGWEGHVDLTDLEADEGDEIELSAYGLLPPELSPEVDAVSVGELHLIGQVRCVVAPTDLANRRVTSFAAHGAFLESAEVPPGSIKVTGTVLSVGDVATLEVFCDGVLVGLARTTPIDAYRENGHDVVRTDFARFVDLEPGAARAVISAQVHTVAGASFSVGPWVPAIATPPERTQPQQSRLAVVEDRYAQRLSRVSTPAETPRDAVLVVTHDLALGGGQLYLQVLLRRLHRRGVRLCVTSPRSGVLTRELEELGIPVLITGASQVSDPEAYEAQVFAISSWAVEQGCRAALANTTSAFAGVDAAVRLGLPVTWAIHESYPLAQFWTEGYGAGAVHPYVDERTRHCLGATRRAVFEATETLELYQPWLAPGAGVVVPYGVDFEPIEEFRQQHERAELRAELGLDPERRVLLCMGTVEPRKSQLNLVQAFAALPRAVRERLQLVIVGARESDFYSDRLRALVAAHPHADIRVELVQPDIERWYHACDVLVSASDVESLPRSMIEAMAFGRPVATTAVFGIPELVHDGESGFLCSDRDAVALQALLQRVADASEETLHRMGETARETALARHDPRIYEDFFAEELGRDGERTGV